MLVSPEEIFAGPLPDSVAGPFQRFCDGKPDSLIESERQELLRLLNEFLATHHGYAIDFASSVEQFRNHLEGASGPAVLRPHVLFSIKSQRLQFVDPNNGTFALQCEASVGVPMNDALAYLDSTGAPLEENAFLSLVSLGGVVWFDDPKLEKRLASVLQIRVHGGEIERSVQYYRFGNVSRHIWLIQTFTLRIYQPADFRNMPFDRFRFTVDFCIGLGGDVANVGVGIDPIHASPSTLFTATFSSGEFKADVATAQLATIGFLEDPTCYFENRVRLSFDVRRAPLPLLLRIVLPLSLMVAMLVTGSFAIRDQVAMATQMIPALFLAMVALQLIVSQSVPRGAPFSSLDGLFALSYALAILLFFVFLLPKDLISYQVVLAVSGLYAVSTVGWLLRPRD